MLAIRTAALDLLGTRDWLLREKFFHGMEGEWFCLLTASVDGASFVCAAQLLACRRPVPIHGPEVEDPCVRVLHMTPI